MRISSGERIQRLGGNGIEERIDRIRVCGLQAGIRLKAIPGRVLLIYVVIDPHSLHLFMVVARV